MNRPKLFIDVDGVILANYGNHFQMRPYVGTFLKRALEIFDCYWLTCHRRESVDAICRLNSICANDIQYADWNGGRYDKVDGVLNTIRPNKSFPLSPQIVSRKEEWYVIEDEYPLDEGKRFLEETKIIDRWIIIPKRTPHALLQAKRMIDYYIAKGGRLTPHISWAWQLAKEKEDVKKKTEKFERRGKT